MAKLSENKKRGFSLQGFDVAHYRQTEGYVLAIEALYNQAIAEFTQSVSGLGVKPEKPFSFGDYPATKAKAQKILNDLAVNMKGVITRGSREQWLYACQKNDEFLSRIMNTSAIPKSLLEKYQDKNLEALKAFQSRKVDGLGLSDRIWNYTGQMKTQMELGIDIALGDGIPASKLAKELKQYLVDPDKLFRRVRDKHGNLVLSKNAKAFHPGQGKYRSSYKNAMRLTRSEINMAYRESDQLRWQQLDFVVGFEVKLSNNHTLNGKPFVDICDDLKGKYPKTFKFTGWHPQCRCHAVPIMEDYFSQARSDDRVNQLKAALNGTEYQKYVSKEAVTDVPDAFKDWIAGNADRARNWKSQPYFIRNNFNGGRIEGGLSIEGVNHFKKIKFSLTEQNIELLKKSGFSEIKNKGYDQHMGGFDLFKFDSELSKICEANGIKIETKILQDIGISNVTDKRLIYKGKLGDEEFKLIRKFSDRNGIKSVFHEEFVLPKSLQNKGISKDILKLSYNEYKKVGVNKIELHAGFDVGGYAWAKYGFKAYYSQIDRLTEYAYEKMTYSEWNKIDNFFKTYKENEMIDMFEIANMPFGKKFLMGSDWSGQLDLDDEFSFKIFEKYLYR